MLPLAYAASRAWLIHWDRFVLPVPFCRIAIAIGPPCDTPRTLDAEGVQGVADAMERTLHQTYRNARAALSGNSL
jgi:lysophospholipid acyltransferase (LPLAT)-like uncharacterized protein